MADTREGQGWNPRFEAWTIWLGFGPICQSVVDEAIRLYGLWSFTAWNGRRMIDAARVGAGVVFRGADETKIVDHDRYTAWLLRFSADNAA